MSTINTYSIRNIQVYSIVDLSTIKFANLFSQLSSIVDYLTCSIVNYYQKINLYYQHGT